jgi:dihydropteroate synthase-like protein
MANDQLHFITGRLAETALRKTLKKMSADSDFRWTIQVMPITVAALMTPAWIAKRIEIPDSTTQIVLPGYCDGDLSPIESVTSVPVKVGPKDLRKLPRFLGRQQEPPSLEDWDIDIIAEINHAPRMTLEEVLKVAERYRKDGATLIDVGCEPNSCWSDVAEYVAALVSEGHRVSIDSLNPDEIAPAVAAGAELVLSVNATNREAAADWGCEVVVIPDDIRDITSMEKTIEFLADKGVPIRLDPILEPIGMGFAQSLQRYMDARRRWPDAAMMMGIGNLTELTDVDSAGVNFLLLAICQELGVHSVLTTEVINWARSSVRECDIARRLVRYAIDEKVPPKNLGYDLVSLRDPQRLSFGAEAIALLAENVKDHNYRILAEDGEVHLLGSQTHWHDVDPFQVFDALAKTNPKNLDASHAFYLGYEMCKAMIANQLGKNYVQDEALSWGHLTVEEKNRHRLEKRFRKSEE